MNTRSFRKHAIDIVYRQCSICLTETQVEIDSDSSRFSELFTDFTICHNAERDKFCSLASCWKSTLNVEHENMLLLYRKNSTSHRDFSYLLSHFLSRCDDCIQVILGDFNINEFGNHQVKDFLGNYTLIINQPTHTFIRLSPWPCVYKNDFMDHKKYIFFSRSRCC